MRKFISIAISSLFLFNLSLPASATVAAPTGISVVSKSTSSTSPTDSVAEVSWTQVTDAIGYSVYASASGVNRSGSVAVCSNQMCTSTVRGLTSGTPWKFYVTALKSATDFTTAPFVSFTPTSVPNPVTGVAASSGVGKATLSWIAPANDGGLPITSYSISGGPKPVSVSGNLTRVDVTDLTAGAKYSFSISAINSIGSSSSVLFSEIAIPAAPAAPAQPSASVSQTTISVGWAQPANGGLAITGYKIYLLDKDSKDVTSKTVPAASQSSSFTDVSVGSYYVQVVASNPAGDSLRSPSSSKLVILPPLGTTANTPVFTPATISSMLVGETKTLTASTPSGDAATITATGSCSFSAGVLSALAAGPCTISAFVAATGIYLEGSVANTFSIKTPQSINFPGISSRSAGTAINLSATANSGLPVSFSVSGPCSLSGGVLSFLGPGICQVTASQVGNAMYATASQVVRMIDITAAEPLANPGGPIIKPVPTPTPSVPPVKPTPTPTPSIRVPETKVSLPLQPGSTVITKQTQMMLTSVTKLINQGKATTVAIPISAAKTTLAKAKAQATAISKAIVKLGLKATVVVVGKGAQATIKVIVKKK